jgi:hypothetical protein
MARSYNSGKYIYRSPGKILRENFGCRQLRCDEGPIRNNLGESADIRAVECAVIRATPMSRIFTGQGPEFGISISNPLNETHAPLL